ANNDIGVVARPSRGATKKGKKRRPRAPFSDADRDAVGLLSIVSTDQAMALMACARRDFVRDARFLCTIFLSAMRSMTACEALSFSAAAALSPPAIALRTALTAVRNDERRLALCLLVCAACRARFLAWALFGMRLNPRVLKLIYVARGCSAMLIWSSQKRPSIIAAYRSPRNG